MPHVNIKLFSRDFTPTEKQDLADALTKVLMTHLQIYEGAISICLEPIPPERWAEAVEEPEFAAKRHLLIKYPNYQAA